MICKDCGSAMTGIGSLIFCSNEENHNPEKKSSCHYLISHSAIPTKEIVLAEGTTIYDSLEKARGDIQHTRHYITYSTSAARKKSWRIYAITSDNMPEGWMVESRNIYAIGQNKVNLIGVKVELVEKVPA